MILFVLGWSTSFKINFFKKFFQECYLRPDILIWVQTVYKGYQQTTKDVTDVYQ